MVVAPTRDPDRWLGRQRSNPTVPSHEVARRRLEYQLRRQRQQTPNPFLPNLGPPPGIATAPSAELQAIMQRNLASARRRAVEQAQQYQTNFAVKDRVGRSGVMDVLQAGASRRQQTEAIAKRYGISYSEALKRIEEARRTTTALKESFRFSGLYAGDLSGDFDPLLTEASGIESARTPEEQDKYIRRYRRAVARNLRKGRQDLITEAGRAQEILASQDPKTSPLAGLRALDKVAGLDDQTKAYLDELAALVRDPRAYRKDPEAVLQGYEVINTLTAQVRDAQPKGFGERALATLGRAGQFLGTPIEELIMQPYYANKVAESRGGGVGRQVNSFLSALPGLGFIAGGVSARDRSAVSTPEKRAALAKAGEIQSFGQTVSDALLRQLSPLSINGYKPFKGMYENQSLSGVFDLGLQVFGDPSTYLGAGLFGKAAQPGAVALERAAASVARDEGISLLRAGLSNTDALIDNAVARAARYAPAEAIPQIRARITEEVAARAARARSDFLLNTRRGQALQQAAADVVSKNFNAADIRRSIPGLDQRVALEMAEATSRNEAMDAFRRAFITGEYNPSVTLRRQLLSTKYGGKALSAPSGVGLGPRVIRQQEGLFDALGFARRAVRGTGVRQATGRSRNYAALADNTLRAGLARANERLDDFYEREVANNVIGLDPIDRLNRAWENGIQGNAALEDLFVQGLKQVEKEALPLVEGAGLGVQRTVEAALLSEPVEAFLKQMETIGALAQQGGKVAQQVAAEAKFGLGRKWHKDARLLTTAIKDTASTVPALKGPDLPRDEALRYLNARLDYALGQDLIDEAVYDALKREVARVGGLKHNRLRALERRIDAVLSNDLIRDEFGRLLRARSELVDAVESSVARRGGFVGLARRAANAPLRLVNSLAEPVSPAHVAFLGYTNTAHAIAQRVEDVDRWVRDLGLDDFTRKMVGDSVARVSSEDDLFLVVGNALRALATREGVPQDLLIAIQNRGIQEVKEGSNKITHARLVDGVVEVADEVNTLAQRGEVVYLPDPEDVRRTIREFKAQDGDFWAKMRVGLAKPLDLKLFGIHGPASGELLTIRNFLMKGHRRWKYLTVVPGMELATLGAMVGFAASDGDIADRLKGAGQGAAVGLLTPVRYIARVAGIEEGLRKYVVGGLNPEMWKPALAKHATQSGLDRPFTLANAVKAGDPLGTSMDRLLATSMGEFEALYGKSNPIARIFRKDARFLDGYSRILNNQIHPETDFVADLLLRRQAGEITADEAMVMYRDFIQTESGRLWLRRLKGGFKGPKTPEEAFARYDRFINTYVFDADVARARLDAAREYAATGRKLDVPRPVLKAAQRRNALPEVIHAEKTFVVPKNFREVARVRDRFARKVFEGPTTSLNRVPMARAFYRDEYTRLLRNGVPNARAQEIAEQVAVEKTNRIMFRINDESRFAAKADFAFPFQQPREELLRVWAPLIAQNPVRAMQVTRFAAVAFNNGKEKGMFTQDQYGNWRMAVPGSAYLSRLLFNTPVGFDFALSDLVFFGQGAYGVNVIPSPGGPYWGAAARLVINRNPQWFESLNPKVKEWLFPYGATGRIFRPEVSRMWQAWLGEPAPFEFASRAEQQDALEKHRRFIFLQLIWQHGKATGNWDWEPSDDELDEAVSASLRMWSMVGAMFPASPGLLRPDAQMVEDLKRQFTFNGQFDYVAFVEAHPELEPWLIGGTETDDDSFEAWARTQEQRVDDTTTHRRRQKPFSEWRKEFEERKRESAAYRERADIQNWPSSMQGEKYAAWDAKYPDLAEDSTRAYYRDLELMHIEGTLIGVAKDEALNSWRKRYGVSFPSYQRLAERLRKGELRTFNPYEAARDTDAVVAEVQRQLRRTTYTGNRFDGQFAAEQAVVARLPVVEQIRYWEWRLNNFDYDWSDDPSLLMDRWYLVKQQRNALFQSAPMKLHRALREDKSSKYEKYVEQLEGDKRKQISDAYAEAEAIEKALDQMSAKRQFGSEYKALRARRQELLALATAIKNEWYKGIPDLQGLAEDIKAIMVFTARGDKSKAQEVMRARREFGFFLPSDEQSSFLSMPSDVQEAYIQELVNSLDIPAGEEGKKFWEWLTEFQQDLLRRNLPKDRIEAWMAETPDSAGSAGGRGRGGRGATGELGFAYEMFKKYNQRGGMKAPAAYAQYLELPNDAAIRSAFLRQHPEVAEYIRLGPMANMPPTIAMLVADIMIRYGKWEGESRSMTEISEIGFAKEMLARWSRRGDRQAPAAFEAWLQMPTGAAKAEYLRQHPEIQEWIQLGPMANMPEAYREVVRDIMYRYQLWTDNQDPLGKVIEGYFSAPSYARDKYLEDHPELVEYWKATRSPEQQRQYDLADQYFSIKDPNARRAYLQVHPELQEWFLNRRQERYENFLNQVAIYMGTNPELFTAYLERQEQVLSDLFHKFSEGPLMRERFILRDSEARSSRAQARAA